MFFDTENCRALRVLHEISGFLEASIEKLLDLEKETLKELEKEKAKRQTESLVNIKEEPVEETSASNDGGVKDLSSKNNPALNVSNKDGSSLEVRSNNSLSVINPERRRLYSIDLSNENNNNPKQIKKPTDFLPENVIIKKELDSLDSSHCSTFRAETSESVPVRLNESLCNNLSCHSTPTATGQDRIIVKKEIEYPNKSNDKLSSTSYLKKEFIETLKNIKPTTIPEDGIVFRECDFFKARIRFRKCFSWLEVKKLLTNAGVEDIEDLAITDKNAIITFFRSEKLEALLSLNNATDLRKIRAFSIEPYKKYTVIEEEVRIKEKHKKPVKRKRCLSTDKPLQ